jgi:hypothetical protein
VALAASATALSPVELLHLSELARSDAPFARIQQQMIGAARRWVAAESVSLFVADAGGKPDEVHSNCLNPSPPAVVPIQNCSPGTGIGHCGCCVLQFVRMHDGLKISASCGITGYGLV